MHAPPPLPRSHPAAPRPTAGAPTDAPRHVPAPPSWALPQQATAAAAGPRQPASAAARAAGSHAGSRWGAQIGATLASLDRSFATTTWGPRIAGSIAPVWLLAAGYYFLMPPIYTSNWSLILPASNSGSTVTLESIGQSTTTPNQPFGNITLSPKVIYREIANSDQVRQAAAASLALDTTAFPRPRIKLIDETSLMMFQITGRSPEDAQARAKALMTAFSTQLEMLRRDELEKRSASVQGSLKLYEATLKAARDKILEFQRASGMLSLSQYNEAVSGAEVIRRKLAELRTGLQKVQAEQIALRGRIGVMPDAAAAGLKLVADPAFAKLAAGFAEANAQYHEDSLRLGPNHPARLAAKSRLDAAMDQLHRIARASNVGPGVDVQKLALFVNGSHQADMLRSVVGNEAMIEGLGREVNALEAELTRLEGEISRMSGDAAKLEYLKKDHLVAEAVYTSAVARLDTSRTDQFSSYPMVQILSEPDLPVIRTQPRLSYAVAGGVAGTILILLAWGAAWARMRFGQRRALSA